MADDSSPARRLRALLPDIEDALAVVGASLLVYGVYLIYPPAAFIVAGILLLVAAYRYNGSNPS